MRRTRFVRFGYSAAGDANTVQLTLSGKKELKQFIFRNGFSVISRQNKLGIMAIRAAEIAARQEYGAGNFARKIQ